VSRGLGDVYKRQLVGFVTKIVEISPRDAENNRPTGH
jgi:hypothetical protein